jgi:hypothetical protein
VPHSALCTIAASSSLSRRATQLKQIPTTIKFESVRPKIQPHEPGRIGLDAMPPAAEWSLNVYQRQQTH